VLLISVLCCGNYAGRLGVRFLSHLASGRGSCHMLSRAPLEWSCCRYRFISEGLIKVVVRSQQLPARADTDGSDPTHWQRHWATGRGRPDSRLPFLYCSGTHMSPPQSLQLEPEGATGAGSRRTASGTGSRRHWQ
jgi:hypothetical protein